MKFIVLVPTIYRDELIDVAAPAPGVRNINLAAAAGGILVALGTSADIVALTLARHSIAEFCRTLVGIGRRREGSSAVMTIKGGGTEISISLKSEAAESEMIAQMSRLLDSLEREEST